MRQYSNAHKITEKGREHEVFEVIYEDKISLSASLMLNWQLKVRSFLTILSTYMQRVLLTMVYVPLWTKSSKIYTWYIRHVSDLPVLGKTVVLRLRMRKFFCSNPKSKFRTFVEQPGIEVFCCHRRTRRCEVLQNQSAVKHSSITAGKKLSL